MRRTQFVDDRGVSPVIGIILIVAITVVLAGVIGTFALNLGDDVNENVKAGASVTVTPDNEVKVTWNSNQNADDLRVDMTGCDTDSTILGSVGDTWTSSTSCDAGDSATLVVTANGDEDAESVIVNKDVSF